MDFYAFFTPLAAIYISSICRRPYSAPRDSLGSCNVDLAFLALLVVLVVMTWGFLRLCARLEETK